MDIKTGFHTGRRRRRRRRSVPFRFPAAANTTAWAERFG